MEAPKGNVREKLDEIMECLRAAEERLDRALEAINGREVQENAVTCDKEAACGSFRREPGILERLELAERRAACVAVKAEELAAAL